MSAPAVTLKAAARFDQTAYGALVERGLSGADVTALLTALADRPAARFGAGVLLVSSAELVPTLENPVLEPSNDLRECVLPVAGVAVAICDDYLTLTRNPDATDSIIRERHAFLAVAPALLGIEAQRLGLQAEVFVDAGTDPVTTSGASFGATTFCTFVATDPADPAGAAGLPRIRASDTLRLEGAYDPTADGRLVGTPHPTQTRCNYASAGTGAATSTTELFPFRTASGVDTLGSGRAIGLTNAQAFDAAVCADAQADPSAAAVVTLACAASARQCTGYAAALPLADVAQRALVFNVTAAGSVHVTMERSRSKAFWSISELALSLYRLTILCAIVVVAEERARIGINARQLLAAALGWAQATPDTAKDAATSDGLVRTVHHASAAIAMAALRIVLFGLSFESRLANRMYYVLVCDGVSAGLSVLITTIRLGTDTQSAEHDLAAYGGSTWVTDGVMALLSISIGVGPLHENVASHGFQAVSRVAAGALLLIQVLPRCVVSVAVCAAFSTNLRFFGAFRVLNAAALVAWMLQTFLVATLTAHLFVYALLFSSSAAVLHPLLMLALAAVATVVGLAFYIVSTLNAVLDEPL